MLRFILISFSLVLGIYGPVISQSKVNFIEGNITLNKATGYFGRNIMDTKVGFEVGYLRQLNISKPVFWGISIYYQGIGRSGTYTFEEPLDFNLVEFDYSTVSQMMGFNGKFRFYPDIYLGKLDFYLEALMGYKWLFTTTNKTLAGDPDSSDSHIEKGRLSLTYGVAAGLNYPLSQSVFLNLRGNYLPGLSKQYYVLDETNTIRDSTLDLFDLKKEFALINA